MNQSVAKRFIRFDGLRIRYILLTVNINVAKMITPRKGPTPRRGGNHLLFQERPMDGLYDLCDLIKPYNTDLPTLRRSVRAYGPHTDAG